MRHFLMLLSIILCTGASAQNFSISLVPSVSIPISDFGDTDQDNPMASYADMGFGGNLEATYWFHPVIGLSVMAGAYSNKLDNTTLAEQLNDALDLDFTVTEDTYTILYAMFGPCLGMNSRTVSISLHPAVGYGIKSDLSYRQFVEGVENDNQQVEYENDSGLMYGLQFSTKFFVTEGFALGFNASLLSGNMEQIGEKTPSISLPGETINQDFSPTVVTAGVNLSFRIGSRDRRHRPGAGFYFGR